jgi:hypothetical protein
VLGWTRENFRTQPATRRNRLGRQGRRGSGGDGAKLDEAVSHCGASPAASSRWCGAQRRKRATPTGASPCGEALGDLHGDGRAADRGGGAHGGGATRVCGGPVGARREGLGEGGGTVRGGGAI